MNLLEQTEQFIQKGSFREAEPYAEKAVQLNPDSAEAHYKLGFVLQRLGKTDQAIDQFNLALRLKPDDYPTYDRLVVAYSHKGEAKKAEEFCYKMLEIEPENPEPYKYLARVRTFSDEDSDKIEWLEESIKKLEKTSILFADLNFALGKIFNDLAQYDSAFEYYEQANKVYREKHPYDEVEKLEKFIGSNIKTFSREFFSQRSNFGHPSSQPIFIIGMPRSGTSLVDQILASHPDIHCAGELVIINNIVGSIATQLGSPDTYPECLLNVPKETIHDIAQQSLSLLVEKSDGEPTRAVDKMPYNFWHLGLIALLFPNARIIHCTRNKMGTALSLFSNRFAYGTYFSYGLDSINHYFNCYTRMMQHWSDVLPVAILDFPYELVVTDTQPQVEKLLEFCEVEWNDACLNPHETKRTLATASDLQVSKPIHDDSLNLWRNYEKHLGFLKE